MDLAKYTLNSYPFGSRAEEITRATRHPLLLSPPVAAEGSMDVLLQTNRDKLDALNAQYTESLEAVVDLQATLIDDILPSVADELELDDDAVEWAREWLADTPTVFRILRRNKFTRSFALESARKTLVWRFHHLWPPSPPSESTTPLIQCLPPPTADPFDRPVLVIRVVSFNDSSDAYKPVLLQAFERLRLYLVHLNESEAWREDEDEREGVPILQYVILLDLKNLSTQSLNIDLLTWTLREAIPHFPGMLAAAFMINYTWAHGAVWSVTKRVVPAAALARVFFPAPREVVGYFEVGRLPSDYGGTLPCLAELEDPLREPWALRLSPSPSVSSPTTRPQPAPPAPSQPKSQQQPPQQQPQENERPAPAPRLHRAASSILLHPRSLLNPFFGYPVAVPLPAPSSTSTPASYASLVIIRRETNSAAPPARPPPETRPRADAARARLGAVEEIYPGMGGGVGFAAGVGFGEEEAVSHGEVVKSGPGEEGG
ncbi:hypothetical protein HMN09_00741400 [Mycena chlorophos]|uniref:CRAL-TRIO domain-containing protein n=1 Tax=Mycena chlorophos TaxID=658473 RepID=A0A8H6SW19_MYCCL|nr:hypothetical protein HMN09_00741400 [Mycena chlorophos]